MKKFFIIGTIKCCFCGKPHGVLHSVHGHGIYSDDVGSRNFFHMECLREIEEDPHRHLHTEVDMAIQINDRLENNIKHNKNIKKDILQKIEILKAKHLESMLPGNGKHKNNFI